MDVHPTLHPTDQTLSSYGLGKLDDRSAEAVNQHLEECPDCRKRATEMSADSFLGRIREAQGRPGSPATAVSSVAGLSMMASGTGSSARPPVATLPPGLADHPDYEILRELGQGGMGVVYLAQNKLMGRMEVLKVVGSHLINRRGVLDRFLGEIRNAARLHHPNVVTAYSVLRLGESFVLAMEYVNGVDLANLVKTQGPRPVVHSCYFMYQAALGLQHAHEHGIVHRDIKPSNLMLSLQGKRAVVKVLDFGLAKVIRGEPTDGTLTYEGQMLGTPDFIAPEQIVNARRADIRADIYSLGCTLYYLLSGGPPFQGDSLYDILQAHHSRNALLLNLARPEVPVELAALVSKLMAKEPERRFQEPKEVAQALAPFFKNRSVLASVEGANAKVSRIGQPAVEPRPAQVDSVPTHPDMKPQAAPTSGPVAQLSPQKPREASPQDTNWESLIDLREDEGDPNETQPTAAPARRPPWIRPAVAAGVLLLGLVAAGAGGLLRVGTPYGTILIEGLSDDDIVEVDGQRIPNITISKDPERGAVSQAHGGKAWHPCQDQGWHRDLQSRRNRQG